MWHVSGTILLEVGEKVIEDSPSDSYLYLVYPGLMHKLWTKFILTSLRALGYKIPTAAFTSWTSQQTMALFTLPHCLSKC